MADTPVGGSGTVAGVTAFDAEDSAPFPTAFAACTANVYAVPFVSPVTTHDAAPLTEQVDPPGDAVTVYPVTAAPPLSAGAPNTTSAEPFPRVAVGFVGASGTVAGVTALDADEFGLLPTAFVANATNVYAVPFARPVTVQVVAPAVTHVCPPGAAVTV